MPDAPRASPPLLASALGAAAFALSACASLPACPSGQVPAVQEWLYFGTQTPSARVTADDWSRFLADTVTPRFPEGLTAWQASGQWRSGTGTIVHEPAYVLSLVHPPGAAAESSVQELVASYKARFAQEAVLRVRAQACTSL